MKKIYKEFFYVPKHEKVSDKVFKTRTILSALTMLVCFAVFCSGTFAWFCSNRSSSVTPITAASYSLSVEIGDTNGVSGYQSSFSYVCPLATEDQHTVTLTHNGTAENGYCVINAGGNTYSTTQIRKGESITLTIEAAQGEEIVFSANWGEYQSGLATYTASDLFYGNGDCIQISTTPYETYTVAEGATLELIAEHYGVSASDILLYNGIAELTVGEAVKIPNTTVTEPLVIAAENYVLYTVAEGVTIEMLAEHYGVPAEDILSFNGITELVVGMEIKIPNTAVTEPFVLVGEVSYVLYTVVEGVTIEMLADYYGVPADEILNFNGITELVVGMEIKIPNTTVEEPFVFEEIPDIEDVATPPNATPSDAEETTPNEEATEPSLESTEPAVPTEPETTVPVETEESTEPTESNEMETVPLETMPIETTAPSETEDAAAPSEAPPDETTTSETESVAEPEAETSAASADAVVEPENSQSNETVSSDDLETTDAQ